MSISFRLRPATLVVAGALLVPCAAFAQDLAPSIVPSDIVLAPVPSSVGSPITAPSNSRPIIDSMEIRDTDVTQVLSLIAGEYKIPIAISEVTGRISYLNLNGQTPEQAIETIVKTARLSMEKQADGTYIISKGVPMAAAPVGDIIPQLPTIMPNAGFGAGARMGGNSSLGQPFSSASSGMNLVPEDDMPALVPTGNSTDAKKRTFEMRVKNVSPSMMAFWLDPANHEMPVALSRSKNLEKNYTKSTRIVDKIGESNNFGSMPSNGQMFNGQGIVPNSGNNPYLNSNAEMEMRANAQFGGGNNNNQGGRGGGNNQGGRGGNGRGGQQGTFQLPTGVDRIVAIDPQNALLVFGTPAGAAELAATIRFLDRPLRQVEIEAQFVSISTSDARTYGLDFSTARGNFNASTGSPTTSTPTGGLSVGFVRGNFQASLTAAINSGRAKILTSPRVTAINNLTASLFQNTITPITLTTTSTVANNGIGQQTGQNIFYIQTSVGLEVTPTINNDDTVTVLMRPVVEASGTPNAQGASQITSQELETIANVRDGDTIALGGLRTKNIALSKTKVPILGDLPIIGQIFTSRSSTGVENELIIFLTARIIRRAGDDDGVGAVDLPIGIGGN